MTDLWLRLCAGRFRHWHIDKQHSGQDDGGLKWVFHRALALSIAMKVRTKDRSYWLHLKRPLIMAMSPVQERKLRIETRR